MTLKLFLCCSKDDFGFGNALHLLPVAKGEVDSEDLCH